MTRKIEKSNLPGCPWNRSRAILQATFATAANNQELAKTFRILDSEMALSQFAVLQRSSSCNKRMHRNAELQNGGRRCSRRMAHSDQPPPSGGQTRRVEPNSVFCKSPNSQTPNASTGPTSAADPDRYLHADVLLSRLRLIFSGFFNFLLAQKIIKNRTSNTPPPQKKKKKISKIGPLGAQS